jgi:hypothetical protein
VSHVPYSGALSSLCLALRKHLFWSHCYLMFLVVTYATLLIHLNILFSGIKSPHDYPLLESDIESIRGWCTANFMKLNINKSRVIFSQGENVDFLD